MGEGEGLEWRGRWERVYEDAKQLASTCRYNVYVDVMNLHVNTHVNAPCYNCTHYKKV